MSMEKNWSVLNETVECEVLKNPSWQHLYNWVLCLQVLNVPMVLSCSIDGLWDILELIISLWLMLHNPTLLILQLLSCWLWLWFLLVVFNLPAVKLETTSLLSFFFCAWLTRFFSLSRVSLSPHQFFRVIVISSFITLNQELCGSVGDGWGGRDVLGTADEWV